MPRPFIPLLAVVLGAWTAGFAACGDDRLDYRGTPGTKRTISFVRGVPAVSTAIDDEPITALIDTGAPISIVNDGAVPGLAAGGHRVAIDAFGVFAADYPVASMDLFPGAAGQTTSFDGILGADFFHHFALSIDYRNQAAWIDDPLASSAADWNSMFPTGLDGAEVETPVLVAAEVKGGGVIELADGCEMDLGATRFLVPAYLENAAAPVWLLVDTGTSAVVIDRAVIEALPQTGRPKLDGITASTSTGPVTAYFTRVWRLAIGDERSNAIDETSVPVLVLPDSAAFANLSDEVGVPVVGFVGSDFLQSYSISLDYPNNRLSAAKFRNLDHVDTARFVRVGFSLVDVSGQWRVGDVYPGTSADMARILPGDIVVSIDGAAVAGLTAAEVSTILGGFGLGDLIPFVFRRDGIDRAATILVEDLLPAFEGPVQ